MATLVEKMPKFKKCFKIIPMLQTLCKDSGSLLKGKYKMSYGFSRAITTFSYAFYFLVSCIIIVVSCLCGDVGTWQKMPKGPKVLSCRLCKVSQIIISIIKEDTASLIFRSLSEKFQADLIDKSKLLRKEDVQAGF